ncbi:hypothetical protein ILP92_13290 [Maribius pontilimi]|uniref:Uncharacterized protein n=1 Tax=Palleronia pontilimi TaxID=1964209 RepID=A0A934MDQ1_9RHOB|nr:hypothetical protein [Palleronia pontilimi]MBJ3763725.1 hypothetical protein [Palleronia pontilimi]
MQRKQTLIDFPDPFGIRAIRAIRAINEHALLRNDADREARAARLAPRKVTDFTKLVEHVGRTVKSEGRPCSYLPWKSALKEYSRVPPYTGKLPDDWHWLPSDLMNFAADIAQPGWPEPRADLIEFAITFLEADVMLFRSGYVKRHLIRRLQQSELSGDQVSRIDSILRRAVVQGAGMEEFRAFRKIAAHLCLLGHLPDLRQWLEEKSRGAILTIDRADGELFAKIMGSAELSEPDLNRALAVNFFGPSKWGVVYPEMRKVVRAGKLVKEPSQQIKHNAYLMLEAIRRREAAQSKSQS